MANTREADGPAPIQILKFGSSVLASAAHVVTAVDEIQRWLQAGYRVVAVVSAVGRTTDELLLQANRLAAHPDRESTAELLATGEAQTVALVKLSLAKLGVSVAALDSASLGIRTRGPLLDADPVGLDDEELRASLRAHSVLVVPGFVARHEDGRPSLLGRGGSDLTTLFLSAHLQASCRLLKDVPGLYEWDPSAQGPAPRRFEQIRFGDALELGDEVVQPKALRFAQERQLQFRVGGCGHDESTLVGADATQFATEEKEAASH